MNQIFTVQGMTCGHCERAVTTAIKQLDPHAEVRIDRPQNRVEVNSGQPREKIAVNYETVFTWAQFDTWLAKIEAAELTALDTETTSLDAFEARIVGISLSVTPGEACYIPLAHTGPGVADHVIVECVAGPVDSRAPGQRQILEMIG